MVVGTNQKMSGIQIMNGAKLSGPELKTLAYPRNDVVDVGKRERLRIK